MRKAVKKVLEARKVVKRRVAFVKKTKTFHAVHSIVHIGYAGAVFLTEHAIYMWAAGALSIVLCVDLIGEDGDEPPEE